MAGHLQGSAGVTAPRTRRWITTGGFHPGITAQVNTVIASGPVTVQRVIVQPTACVDGGATLRWPWWEWGLQYGAAPASLGLPLVSEAPWLVWRRVFMQNPATRPICSPSPPQTVDTEGQRILPAGQNLYFSCRSKDASQVTDFTWYARVLVLDPV